jgi:protein TonB
MKNDNFISKITIIACIVTMIPLLGQCSKEEPVSTLNNSANNVPTETPESIDLPYAYDQLTVKPEIIHKEQPGYPETARKNGISGMIVVTVTIDEIGNVIEATIFSSDNSVLDSAALEAAKKCKFKPAEMYGQQVKVSMNLPYKFALK